MRKNRSIPVILTLIMISLISLSACGTKEPEATPALSPDVQNSEPSASPEISPTESDDAGEKEDLPPVTLEPVNTPAPTAAPTKPPIESETPVEPTQSPDTPTETHEVSSGNLNIIASSSNLKTN